MASLISQDCTIEEQLLEVAEAHAVVVNEVPSWPQTRGERAAILLTIMASMKPLTAMPPAPIEAFLSNPGLLKYWTLALRSPMI